MRLVPGRRSCTTLYERASGEAHAAFGDGALYIEKAITPARHVEIQVICDDHGGVLSCGERECSIQRRHQKLIEESPSPALDAALREEMESAAERACRHIDYAAGTFEFLVGPDGSFSFIELNTRLQVEHPVSEAVTRLDLVRMQVEIAAGRAARADGPGAAHRATRSRSGSTPRIRPAASRRARGRSSASGRRSGRASVSTRSSPTARDPGRYDSLLAKSSSPTTRARRRSSGRCGCSASSRCRGVPTTREAALDIIASDEFRSGVYSTSFLEEAGAGCPR